MEPEPGQAGADAEVQTDSGQEWRAYSAVEELQPQTKTGFEQMIFLLREDESQSESHKRQKPGWIERVTVSALKTI